MLSNAQFDYRHLARETGYIERRLAMGFVGGTMMVDGEVIYVAKGLRVGLIQANEQVS